MRDVGPQEDEVWVPGDSSTGNGPGVQDTRTPDLRPTSRPDRSREFYCIDDCKGRFGSQWVRLRSRINPVTGALLDLGREKS